MKITYGPNFMSIKHTDIDRNKDIQKTEQLINSLWQRVTGQGAPVQPIRR